MWREFDFFFYLENKVDNWKILKKYNETTRSTWTNLSFKADNSPMEKVIEYKNN